MRLSIIIPAYNVEKYITECLDSLLDQGLEKTEYEIIIVNDCSTDTTPEIAQAYAREDPHIKIVNKPNGGAGSARNKGMALAQGTYVYFIDPDDFLLPNCLSRLLNIAEIEELDILTFMTASFASVSPNGRPILDFPKRHGAFTNGKLSSVITGKEYVAHNDFRNEVWWYLIKRSFLESSEIKFVEGQFLEDAIFTIDLFLKAGRMAHMKVDAHRYRTTPGSAMTKREPDHYIKIIRDIQSAALSYEPIIKNLQITNAPSKCIARVETKQQSLVFFSMVRILKSTMGFSEVKQRMHNLVQIDAYPLDAFIRSDAYSVSHRMVARLFNKKHSFYFLFHLLNPILKHRN